MTEIKYCEDCKYHKPYGIYIFGTPIFRFPDEDLCVHPIVSNRHIRNNSDLLCKYERKNTISDFCGRVGTRWEAKEF